MRHMRRTIIIIHPGALGDVLLAVPAMRRLRARFPRHELMFCANEPVAQLLLECRVIDAWESVQGISCLPLFDRSQAVAGQLKDWLGRCDLAVAWTQDEEGTLATVLQRCGARDVRVGSPFSPLLRARHQSDRFVETLQEPASGSSPYCSLSLPDHRIKHGLVLLNKTGVPTDQRLILVHPGSGSQHKCVRAQVLVRVIERLQEAGALPLILEGPADEAVVTDLLNYTPSRPTVFRGLDLCTLAALLSHMQLVIGHDSGVTQLSALLGVQTVALFGPTDPIRWAPRGTNVSVVRGTPCKCQSWDAVTQCAEKACLSPSVEAVTAACGIHHHVGATPRNPSQSALSLPMSYVTVTS